MSRKLTYEYVNNYFKSQGCTLLSKKYTNAYTKIRYICLCGDENITTQNRFQRGGRCKKCSIIKLANKLRLSIEEISDYFKSQGCILLSKKYINANKPLEYICSCGNVSTITYSNFKSGKRCMECSGTKKLTYEYVNNYFKSQGCTLLETEYINNDTKMKFICSCGRESELRWSCFSTGKRCWSCTGNRTPTHEQVVHEFKERGCVLLETEYINTSKKMKFLCSCGNISVISRTILLLGCKCSKCGGNERPSYEQVKDYFKSQGCTLLETEYVNMHTKMRYICSCGNESITKFTLFKRGYRCGCKRPSYGESVIIEDLKRRNIRFLPEHKFNDCRFKLPLPFDFYLPEHNICIEYDGKQHYEPIQFGGININRATQNFIECIERDEIKNQYCKDSGIKLIRIPYTEFNNIEQILTEELELYNEETEVELVV